MTEERYLKFVFVLSEFSPGTIRVNQNIIGAILEITCKRSDGICCRANLQSLDGERGRVPDTIAGGNPARQNRGVRNWCVFLQGAS